jgi:DHA1 family quinolone resistance protein-like MFS transporter
LEARPPRVKGVVESFLSLKRNVVVMSLTGLLTNFGASTFQPFIPLFLLTLGATVPEIGLVYVGTAVAANLSIFGGFLADRIGRKITIVVGGLIGFGLFLSLSVVSSWTLALFVLFAAYFFATLVQPAVTSTLAESVDLKDRANAFSTFWFLASLGLAVGVLVGGYLPNPGGFQLNIFVIGVVGIAAALARLGFLGETLPPEARSSGTIRRHSLSGVHMSRNVWLVMAALLLFNFSSGLGQPLYVLFSVEQLQLSVGQFSIMVAISYLALMGGAFGAGRISKSLGLRRMMIIAVVFSGLLVIPWIYAPNPYIAIGVFAVSGFFVQFYFVGNQALMSNITKAQERSLVIGFITTFAGLGAIAAPYLGSQLWTLIDPRTPFLISVLLSVLAAIPLVVVSETPVEPMPPEVPFQRWFCRYCGREINPNATFCSYCGRNVV